MLWTLRALIQTLGRAARNVHSKAILYGDTITGSMQRAIDLTNRHREKQIRYNMEHGIVPRQIVKSTDAIIGTTSVIERAAEERRVESGERRVESGERRVESGENKVAERRAEYGKVDKPASIDARLLALTKDQLRKEIRERQRKMQLAAKELDFMAAATYRDEIKQLQNLLETAR